jgi:sporulation protein YlmC with PRC-barrel domain
MARNERLKELDDKYEDYAIYDNAGEKIGKVDDVFINETDREEYIGVKMGLFGLSGTTLIPMEIARVDEQERRIEVATAKDQAKNAPHYHDDDDIDHEFEAKIREHFGLERQEASPERGTYGRYIGATLGEGGTPSGVAGATSPAGSEDRNFVGRETHREREELGGPAGERSAGPAEERTIRRDVDEPSEQTVTIIRVRRVDIME